MTKKEIEKKFKRFKKNYFKGREGFSGEELVQCRLAFMKKLKITPKEGAM